MHLHHYAEDQINEMQSHVRSLLKSVLFQQKKSLSDMYQQIISYVTQGLKKLDQLANVNKGAIQNRIFSCSQDVNATLQAATAEFTNLADESEVMLATAIDSLKKEPLSDDSEEINDEIDVIVEDFKEKFNEKINTGLEDLLRQTKITSVSLPLKVKECIDDVLNKK